jgi:hypothetical protein
MKTAPSYACAIQPSSIQGKKKPNLSIRRNAPWRSFKAFPFIQHRLRFPASIQLDKQKLF